MSNPAIKSDDHINSDAADRLFLLTSKLEIMRGMVDSAVEGDWTARAKRGELVDYIEMCIAIARGIYRVDRHEGKG